MGTKGSKRTRRAGTNGRPRASVDAAPDMQATEGLTMVGIELPLAEVDPGRYATTHVDVQLNATQAQTMRRVCDGMREARAELENGRYVQGPPDVVRHILEQVAEQAD